MESVKEIEIEWKEFSHWEYVYCCVMPSLTELHVYINFFYCVLLHFLPILKLDFIPLRYLVDYAAEIILLFFFSRKRMPRFIYGCAYWAFRFLFRCARLNIFTYVLFFSAQAHNCARLLHCDQFDLLGTNGMKEVALNIDENNISFYWFPTQCDLVGV